ncbi:MAG: type II secretion system F family protein [Actinomycetota bacterium]|nr:type II secretion system F family protein [Actinomycetota bacterium]
MILLGAVLVGVAVALAFPVASGSRLAVMFPGTQPARPARRLSRPALARLSAAVAAISAFLLLGGHVGIAAALALWLGVPRLAGRLESRASRDRKARLLAQAPVLADLLAATLASGAAVDAAVGAVAGAVGEPAAGALRPVTGALALGADPVRAWSSLAGDPALGAVADAFARSAASGASLASVLARVADDARREHAAAVEVAARSAGVRAVLPLAACFLPAFLLLGVVPVVAALATGTLTG